MAATARKAAGVKRRRCTPNEQSASPHVVVEDKAAAVLPTTTTSELDVEVGRIMQRAFGQHDIRDSDPTNPDARNHIEVWSEITVYGLPLFCSVAALLIKLNYFLSSKLISTEEVDEDGNATKNMVMLDLFDAELQL